MMLLEQLKDVIRDVDLAHTAILQLEASAPYRSHTRDAAKVAGRQVQAALARLVSERHRLEAHS